MPRPISKKLFQGSSAPRSYPPVLFLFLLALPMHAQLAVKASWGDVVITEVMADPTPEVGLPGVEYLELLNRSGREIDPDEWILRVNEREYPVAELWKDILPPGTYAVLTGLQLPNQGAMLELQDPGGRTVHFARYAAPFDAPKWKTGGGWSLESPAPGLPCRTSELWQYSRDLSGGTPGGLNSVDADLVDRDAPLLLYIGAPDPGPGMNPDPGLSTESGEQFSQVCLWFSEPVTLPGVEFGKGDSTGLLPGISLFPGGIPATDVRRELPPGNLLVGTFPRDALSRSEYRIRLSSVADCSGNVSDALEISGGIAGAPRRGVLLFSEIMFDPPDGAPQYVEFFNPGPGYADLQALALDVVPEGEVPEKLQPLADHSRLVAPGQYVVISRDSRHLREAYGLEPSGSWCEVPSMERLPAGGGTLYLTDRNGQSMDIALFRDDMHLDLLPDSKGISLERVSWVRPGSDPSNWHSAASIAGYATPGRENSQAVEEGSAGSLLELVHPVFSPDNDGYRDLLEIRLGGMDHESVIRLWITDLEGRLVRQLANNHLTGPSATYHWDGRGMEGRRVCEGFYVVHLKGYHPSSGNTWRERAAAGVTYR